MYFENIVLLGREEAERTGLFRGLLLSEPQNVRDPRKALGVNAPIFLKA